METTLENQVLMGHPLSIKEKASNLAFVELSFIGAHLYRKFTELSAEGEMRWSLQASVSHPFEIALQETVKSAGFMSIILPLKEQ